ncbi:MAG: LamG-like jellyroll fold domain-containing protein [Kiritimatiellota bacterium]|nr:LamG-like jellyroll fold domain-containing protein [Kiritimatiellota bacterium]
MSLMVVFMAGLLSVVSAAGLQAVPTTSNVIEAVKSGRTADISAGVLTFIQFSEANIRPDREFFRSPKFTAGFLMEAAELYPQAAFVLFSGGRGDSAAVFDQAVAKSPWPRYIVPGIGENMTWPLAGWTFADSLKRSGYDFTPRPLLRQGDNLFLLLSSLLPRFQEGALDPHQLRWIDKTLGEEVDKNVFLVMHHGWHDLMNRHQLAAVLERHRPRQRSITVLHGYNHNPGSMPVERSAINYVGTPPLTTGIYRVFHVCRDGIVTYECSAVAYARLMPNEWIGKQRVAELSCANLFTQPVILPIGPAPDARPVGDDSFTLPAWRADKEAPPGDILRVDLAGNFDPDWIFRDQSDCGNDLYAVTPFLYHRAGIGLEQFRSEHDGRRGLRFGPGGIRELAGYDAYSLNAPHLSNRITIEAQVYIPRQRLEQDEKRRSHIVSKGAYELAIDNEGRAVFKLLTGKGEAVALARQPLEFDRWHHLLAGCDGNKMYLFIDGQMAVTLDLPAGARIRAATGPGIAIGFTHGRHPLSFIIGRFRVSNLWEANARWSQ